jgi:hypothetical protein
MRQSVSCCKRFNIKLLGRYWFAEENQQAENIFENQQNMILKEEHLLIQVLEDIINESRNSGHQKK